MPQFLIDEDLPLLRYPFGSHAGVVVARFPNELTTVTLNAAIIEALRQSSSVSLWTGIGSMVGLTFHRPNGLDISVGLGTDTEQRGADPVTREETVELASAAGLFIDRNESLLATVHLTEVRHRLLGNAERGTRCARRGWVPRSAPRAPS